MIHQGHCRPSELAAHSGDRGTVPVVNRRDPRAPRRAPIADAAVRAGGFLLTHGGGPGIPSAEMRPSTHRGAVRAWVRSRLRQHRRAIWTTNLGKKSGRERKKALAKTWGVRPGRSFRGPSRAAAVKDGARLRDPPRQRRAASLTAASTTAGCVGLGRHTSHRWFANRAPLLGRSIAEPTWFDVTCDTASCSRR